MSIIDLLASLLHDAALFMDFYLRNAGLRTVRVVVIVVGGRSLSGPFYWVSILWLYKFTWGWDPAAAHISLLLFFTAS